MLKKFLFIIGLLPVIALSQEVSSVENDSEKLKYSPSIEENRVEVASERARVLSENKSNETLKGRVGINTVSPQATLDIKKVEIKDLPAGQPQGVLFPSFTTQERDTFDKSKVIEGTMIFNTTTKCIEVFVEGSWKCLDFGL